MEPNWPRLLEGYTFSVNDIHAGHGANGLTIYLPEAGASLVSGMGSQGTHLAERSALQR